MTSIIKVDNLQNQCGANIINENAGTITIGACGDTVTLAAGASQSGFGRSGSVNWDTTPKTTSGFTAVSWQWIFYVIQLQELLQLLYQQTPVLEIS
jgi:hypothetical protein